MSWWFVYLVTGWLILLALPIEDVLGGIKIDMIDLVVGGIIFSIVWLPAIIFSVFMKGPNG